MRALIQRVKRCSVSINGALHSSIGQGILILLGVGQTDKSDDAAYLAERCAHLRIFDDTEGKMNRSVLEVQGSALVVSQFTLYGDTRKGNRPSYSEAAPPDVAEKLYNEFVSHLRRHLSAEKVATGVFRAMMEVELVNDGPVTVLLESKNHR
ncbi:MAG TPA: D-aminoacyl-tRNA deacylase [Bacteroidota bacterium]|nr:D-aminoacyl-tRNA deacylase [Bacteroidota bacterium]